MSDLEKQYQKMIETLENSIKDKDELMKAKEQLDDIVSIVVDDCNEIMDRYDERIKKIQDKNSEYETRITILEEKLRYFEKMVESEDYDFFITCPYCGFVIFEIILWGSNKYIEDVDNKKKSQNSGGEFWSV